MWIHTHPPTSQILQCGARDPTFHGPLGHRNVSCHKFSVWDVCPQTVCPRQQPLSNCTESMCRFWLSESRVGPETLHVQQASRWYQACCSPDHCLRNELPYHAAQTLIHSEANTWAPVRPLRAAWLAWTLKVMSANGCSAGFPPGEWAQLAHLSEGEAKAIGPHLLWALRKAKLNLAPQQPSCGETGFTDNCLQPQSGTGHSTGL